MNKLPESKKVPLGTVYNFKGNIYENTVSGWVICESYDFDLSKYTEKICINSYVEEEESVNISPIKQRSRGRPKKEKQIKIRLNTRPF
jgi:hypothetical protein